jgi:hypothetical protein
VGATQRLESRASVSVSNSIAVMRTIFVFIFVATFFALTYGGFHYWVFLNHLEQARLERRIPLSLLVRRTSIRRMMSSHGAVPNGDSHRLKSMWAFGIFLSLWVVGVTVAIFVCS